MEMLVENELLEINGGGWASLYFAVSCSATLISIATANPVLLAIAGPSCMGAIITYAHCDEI